MSTFIVASLAPRYMNIHGDAQNAQVLAARARWRGITSDVVEIHSAEDTRGLMPNAITIGAGFDSDAIETLMTLKTFSEVLHEWSACSVPLLAVGLGWELLSQSSEIDGYGTIEGVGIFSGHFVRSDRSVGPMVLESPWDQLIGYEYHYRDYVRGAEEQFLGKVKAGVGNLVQPKGERVEGAVSGMRFGTTMRGPILARNPNLADAIIGSTTAVSQGNATLQVADEYAARTNRRVILDSGLAHTDT